MSDVQNDTQINFRDFFTEEELGWNERADIALVDVMTGAFSRNAYEILAPRQFEEIKRNDRDLSLVVIDLNDFKGINDSFGHAVADEMLKGFVKDLTTSIRKQDYLFRYGGDEFVILLHDINAKTARQNLWPKIDFALKKNKLTAAIGVAGKVNDDTLETLFNRADKLMYDNKKFIKKKN